MKKLKEIGLIRKNILITIGIFIILMVIEYKFVPNDLFQYNLTKSDEMITSIVGVILGIVFALYFFILEMFRNKYPLNFVRDYIEKNLKIILGQCMLNICINLIFIVSDNTFFLTNIVGYVQLIYIFYLLYKLFMDYNIFCSDKIVQQEESNISKIIKSNNISIVKIIDSLTKLNKYSEEGFYNNNLEISNKVLYLNKKLIEKFIKEIDELIIDEKLTDDDFKTFCDIIIGNIINQIKFGINYNSINFVEESFYAVEDLIEKVIKCDKKKVFVIIENKIDSLYNYCNDNNQNYCISIIKMYARIGRNIIIHELNLDNTREEWIDRILDSLSKFNFLNNIQYNYNTVNQLMKIYTSFICEFIKNSDKKYYDKLIDEVIANMYRGNILAKDDTYLNCFIVHTISEWLFENKKNQWIEEYSDKLYNIAINSIESKNNDMVIIILSCYEIFEKGDINIKSKVNKHRYNLSRFAIDQKDEWMTVFLPDYLKIVSEDKNDQKIINDMCEDFKGLLYKSLVKKKIEDCFYMFEILNEIAELYQKSDKDKQISLIEVYFEFLSDCVNLNEEESFNVALTQMQTIIKKWDKECNISIDLGEKIIFKLYDLSKSSLDEGQPILCINSNRVLFYIENELNISLRNSSIHSKIIEYVFQIAIDAIERGEDSVLKNISNNLGWIGKEIIDAGKKSSFVELIDIVTEIVNLYYDINIDDETVNITNKTMIFLGTLYIILGAYCSCEIKRGEYSDIIVKNGISKIKNKSFFKYSKMLRYFEGDRWNKIIKDEPKKHIEKFYKHIESSQEIKA